MTKSKLSDAEMIEILAVRGMGWVKRDGYWGDVDDRVEFCIAFGGWNPLADPEGMGPIREVEERLTEEQWATYTIAIQGATFLALSIARFKAVRHADPRTCVEALCRVLAPERFTNG